MDAADLEAARRREIHQELDRLLDLSQADLYGEGTLRFRRENGPLTGGHGGWEKSYRLTGVAGGVSKMARK